MGPYLGQIMHQNNELRVSKIWGFHRNTELYCINLKILFLYISISRKTNLCLFFGDFTLPRKGERNNIKEKEATRDNLEAEE